MNKGDTCPQGWTAPEYQFGSTTLKAGTFECTRDKIISTLQKLSSGRMIGMNMDVNGEYYRSAAWSSFPWWTFNAPNAHQTFIAGSTANMNFTNMDALDIAFNATKFSIPTTFYDTYNYNGYPLAGVAPLDNLRTTNPGKYNIVYYTII